MEQFWNRVRQEIARQIADLGIAAPRMGIITGYDETTHSGKVLMMPEGAFPDQSGDVPETGWIPIAVHQTGAGFGIYSPPSPGDQVYVTHQEHDAGAGVITGRINDANHMPPPVPAGEIWIVQQSGSFVKLTADGHITVMDKAGSKVVLTNDGQMTLEDKSGTTLQFQNNGTLALTGNLTVSGTIVAQKDITSMQDVISALRNIILGLHQHMYVPGSGTPIETAAPTPGT